MPQNIGSASIGVSLDLRNASRQFAAFQRQLNTSGRNSNLFSSISADAKDFENSLGKATNRVVAFASAAAVFGTLAKTAQAFAQSIVEVDNSLAKINVNLGQSAESLKAFGAQVFNVARQTGQTFEVAAKAAEELARQGLGAEDTIDRLQKALVLSRIAGIDSAEAVNTLTAAINSFNESALTAGEIVNKFAAVDTKFAVSSKDLAEAVSRVGSTAQSAGVGIDQLIGLVTSLQQTTARGGATIGNGLKTIFTRIQSAPETINALESVGVAIKNTDGSLRDAISILRDYSAARDKVGEVERQGLDRTVAGTFQINILKAALADLGKEYSVYGSAVKTSANATDEAIRKNEVLNQTLESLINSTSVSIKEFFASVGSQNIGPILSTILKSFEKARAFFSGDSGSDLGKSLGDGLIKGISAVITGPALGALILIVGNAFKKVIVTIGQEARTLLSINSAVQARANAQKEINTLLGQSNAQERVQLALATSTLETYEALLAVRTRIAQESLLGTPLTNLVASKGGFSGKPSIFADPIRSAMARESAASGLPMNQVYVDRDARVATFANPMGILVANRRDEPLGGYQGVNRVLSQGGNPKTNGIPGFAATRRNPFDAEYAETQKRLKQINKEAKDFGVNLKSLSIDLKKVDKVSVEGFKTALGSSYKIDSSGNTIRTKRSPGKGQGATSGALPVVYLDAQTAAEIEQELSTARIILTENGKQIRPKSGEDLRGRKLGISAIDKATGKTFFSGTTHSSPAIGLSPFEIGYQGDQKTYHLGNKIVEINGGPNNPTSRRIKVIYNGEGFDNGLPKPFADPIPSGPDFNYYRKHSAYGSPIGPPNPFSPHSDPIGPAYPINPEFAEKLGEQADIRSAQDRERAFIRSQARRRAVAAGIVNRRQRIQDGTLAASFALPLIGGFAEPAIQGLGFSTKGGTIGGGIAGALSYGSSGAGVGGLFGLPGLAIGGGLGILVGAFSKLTKSVEEITSELDEQIEVRSKETDSLARAVQAQEQLNEARKDGADKSTLDKLEAAFREARSGLTNPASRSILGISDSKLQTKAVTARQEEVAREESQLRVRQLLLNPDVVNQFQKGGANGSRGNETLGNEIGRSLSDKDFSSISDGFVAALSKSATTNFNVRPNVEYTPRGDAFIKNEGEIADAAEAFNNAVKLIAPLASKLNLSGSDLNKQNLQGTLLGLLQSIGNDRANRQQDTENKKNEFKGLPIGSFLSPLNGDVATSAALTGRNPAANRGARSQASFDFYNELQGAGGVGKEVLESLPGYKQSRAGVESKNLTDFVIKFLTSNNPSLKEGNLRDSRGNANLTSIERVLSQVSGGGTSAAGKASDLLALIPKLRETLTVNKISTAGYIEGVSGYIPGANYGAFDASRKRGGPGYITSANLRGRSNRLSLNNVSAALYDGTNVLNAGDSPYLTSDELFRRNNSKKERFDLQQEAPTVFTRTQAPGKGKDLDANLGAAGSQPTVQTVKADINVNVTGEVAGSSNDDLVDKVVSAISEIIQKGLDSSNSTDQVVQAILQKLGVPVPKPLPPGPKMDLDSGLPTGPIPTVSTR